jgi:EF-hand domain pair
MYANTQYARHCCSLHYTLTPITALYCTILYTAHNTQWQLGLVLTDPEVQSLFSVLDTDSSGHIDFSEFKEWLLGTEIVHTTLQLRHGSNSGDAPGAAPIRTNASVSTSSLL